MSAIYLFFDESGDFNFSPSGSPYYYFGALTTRDPLPISHALTEVRYELIRNGLELERFHATEDRQHVRDRVFAALGAYGGFEFDCVVVEKRKAHPSLYDAARFYPQFAAYLLRYVFKRYADPKEPVILITDRIPVKKREQAVEKAFKTFMRTELGDRSFSVLHHASAAHPCLQAADYCTWAVHKKWKDNELRPFNAVSRFVRSEFDIFANGTETHY